MTAMIPPPVEEYRSPPGTAAGYLHKLYRASMKMISPSSMANTNVNGGSLPKQIGCIVHRERKY